VGIILRLELKLLCLLFKISILAGCFFQFAHIPVVHPRFCCEKITSAWKLKILKLNSMIISMGFHVASFSLGSLLGKIMGSKNNHGVQHCAIGYPAKIPFWESAESQSSSPRKLPEQGGKS